MPGLIQNVPTASATAAAPALKKTDTPAKIHDAAQQFEALLLGQILSTVSNGGGWLGGGGDSASGCATGFAEQQLAAMMARSGGMGLAALIERGLQAKADPAAPSATPASSASPSSPAAPPDSRASSL